MNSKAKNRRDHYLPQAYLRGFIDPDRVKEPKPVWCFDLHAKRCRERAPKELGYIDGFYDLAAENTAVEHPDITFKRLENDFPRVRNRILREGFDSGLSTKKTYWRTCK